MMSFRFRPSATVAVALLGAGIVAGSIVVDAAVVPNPVTGISVTPTNPEPGGDIRVVIDFCVPDSTRAGDTFSVQLPPELERLPSGLSVRDPDGLVVATAGISGTPPVVSFTFTDYVDTRTDVCGSAFFGSRLDDDVVSTTTLVFVVNGGGRVEVVVNPGGGDEPGPIGGGSGTARKGTFFDDEADECRTVAENCVGWNIDSRRGPLDEVVVEDGDLDGISFSCDTLQTLYRRNNGSTTPVPAGSVDVTCSADQLLVVIRDVPADERARVQIRATPDVIDEEGGVLFRNSAVVTQTSVDGTVFEDTVRSRRVSAEAGGVAVGVTTTTVPTTMPPTTAPPTTAPPTTTPPTSGPTTSVADSTTTTVASGGGVTTTVAPPDDTTTTTSIVASGAVTTTSTPNTVDIDRPLPATGSSGGIAVLGLLVASIGGLLVVASARRRVTP